MSPGKTGRKTSIPAPADILGFEVGEDRKLAGWSQIGEYFEVLSDASDRVRSEVVGESTEGNPFLVATISSPANLQRLDDYRRIQSRLADPRTLDGAPEADALLGEGRAVVMVLCSIHGTEVGAAQMSMSLAEHLAADYGQDVARILDEVILLLVPSANPDGLILVKEWYDGTLGTPHEGVNPPFLYHKYAGHDNNRDWFMFTQAETRLMVEHCLNAWHPNVVLDLHQTRSTGMRMILPPLLDPIDPNIDPVIQSQMVQIGSAIAAELTSQGKAGVAMNVVYDAYSPSRFYAPYHGGVRVLSEAAGVDIASPVDVHRNDLKSDRGENPTQPSWNHPMPWPGGRWTLRDIMEYDFAAVMACLGHAARHRDTLLRNFYAVNRRAVSGGGNPHAFLVPQDQRDAVATAEMLGILRTAETEVHRAERPFVADGTTFPAGTTVIFTAQPSGAFVKTMMETQHYPDLRQYPGGPPKEPYDATAHTLPLMMGVDTVPVSRPFDAEVRLLDVVAPPAGRIVRRRQSATHGYLLRPETNASVRAVNRLLAVGARVERARSAFAVDTADYPAGAFLVEADAGLVEAVATDENLVFEAVDVEPNVERFSLSNPRIGIYKSFVPSPEEGWTRFVLEEYGFDYKSLANEDVRRGKLAQRFDVVVLPHQRPWQIQRGNPNAPRGYSDGLGGSGADALVDFVSDGGILVAWDGAARYAVDHLKVPAKNVLDGLSHSDYFVPGSLLTVLLDDNHPIAYGMAPRAAAMVVGGPAFETDVGDVVGRYPLDEDPLLSGWLVGADKIQGRAALVTVPMGRGEAVLMGFRPHFRAQTRGTYKILFNSLFYGPARRAGPR